MTFLYSCRTDGDQYRITKLTHDLEVESSYLCDLAPAACECPSFERRGRCRHLEMLPRFIQRQNVNTGWLFDFDRGGWVDNRTYDEINPEPVQSEPIGPLPNSVIVIGLEDPSLLHNTLAQVFGEDPSPPAPAETKPWRRF